ncbi:hypothetical protein PLICRDRAFT_40823 [Plicaturopsis crispa FD-325 SS-3]|nr:hypothetical protein PLICRDRAFT_40823 [Plicaturopsis crispa FD-325 SS-3]
MSDLPLPTLFSRALAAASKASNLPTAADGTQELIQGALADLRRLNSRIVSLSLFSPNETLEDIATRDLVFLFVSYVCAEVQGRVRTVNGEERIITLKEAQTYLRTFLSNLENYNIVPEEERQLHEQKGSAIGDPAMRRETKIKQYKKEKELRTRIEAVRKRRRQRPVEGASTTDFDLIASLLPSPSATSADDDEDDDETDEILRETALLLLRLTYAQAHAQLESMDQETQILLNAPPPPPLLQSPGQQDQRGKRKEEEDTWRLDSPATRGDQGPLLDPAGKPLRPFTILSSDAADRARLQSQVFGPGHRLPTMSVDEYLEIERQRGNIITGGGAASAAAPTDSEQLAIDAEADGTAEGAEKEEQKRLKDENWARYTDENPRGAGNTMNRG